MVVSCGMEQSNKATRKEYLNSSKGSVHISVAWTESFDGEGVKNAITMAAEEINASNKIKGRELVINYHNDGGDVTASRLIAQGIVDNPKTLGVVGHYTSYITLPNLPAYEYNNVIMINPASVSSEINSKGYKHIFSNIPNSKALGDAMADYSQSRGYKKVFIYFVRNDYGQSIANGIENSVDDSGKLTIVSRLPYDSDSKRDMHLDIETMKKLHFDLLILIGEAPYASDFVKTARSKGLNQPILNDGGLITKKFLDDAGPAAEGVHLMTPFFHEIDNPKAKKFVTKYVKRNGTVPGVWAAQIYDSIHLLAHAANSAKTLQAPDIAKYLKSMPVYEGVTGDVVFNSEGTAVGKDLGVIIVKDGQFDFSVLLENNDDKEEL